MTWFSEWSVHLGAGWGAPAELFKKIRFVNQLIQPNTLRNNLNNWWRVWDWINTCIAFSKQMGEKERKLLTPGKPKVQKGKVIIIYYLAQHWVEFTCLSNTGWDSWMDRLISSSLGSFQPHFSSLPQYVFLFFHSLFIYFWLHRVFAAAHGFSLAAVLRLLIAVASLVAEHRL